MTDPTLTIAHLSELQHSAGWQLLVNALESEMAHQMDYRTAGVTVDEIALNAVRRQERYRALAWVKGWAADQVNTAREELARRSRR